MKRLSDQKKCNLLKAAWNAFGAGCWLYNIKAYAKSEAKVDEMKCADGFKKFLHGCYKFDYAMFLVFSVICAYISGKALGDLFTPDPDDQEVTNDSENSFKEVE